MKVSEILQLLLVFMLYSSVCWGLCGQEVTVQKCNGETILYASKTAFQTCECPKQEITQTYHTNVELKKLMPEYKSYLNIKEFLKSETTIKVLEPNANNYEKLVQDLTERMADVIFDLGYAEELSENIEKAIQLYKEVISINGLHVMAYYKLGHLVYIQKQYDEYELLYASLAKMIKAKDKTKEVLQYFKDACLENKEDWELYMAHGYLLMKLEEYTEATLALNYAATTAKNNYILHIKAIECSKFAKKIKLETLVLDSCLALRPRDQFCSLERAKIYKKFREFNKAWEHIVFAISGDLKNIDEVELAIVLDAFNLAAEIRQEEVQYKEAIDLYNQIIGIDSNSPKAYYNLGKIFRAQHQYEKSTENLLKAIELDPEFYERAYVDVGNNYQMLGQISMAIHYYQKDIEKSPSSVNAYRYLSQIYYSLNDIDQAFKNAYKFFEIYGESFVEEQTLSTAIDNCYWNQSAKLIQRYEALNGVKKDGIDTNLPLSLKKYPLYNSSKAAAMTELVANQIQKSALQKIGYGFAGFTYPNEFGKKSSKTKIRLAYPYSHYDESPTAWQVYSLFEHHDRRKFELYCYAFNEENGSKIRELLISECDVFRDLSSPNLTIYDIAKLVNKDEIDILIHLDGYTKPDNNMYASLQPAPVQIQFLEHTGSMGASYFNYIVTDKISSPLEHQHLYKERFIWMPNTYFINGYRLYYRDVLKPLNQSDIRIRYGLPENKFIYSCLSDIYKIEPKLFKVWMNILRSVPESILVLHSANNVTKRNILNQVEVEMISRDRVKFLEEYSKEEYLTLIRGIDLNLDTLHFNGRTSSIDAIWAGVPMITLPGDRMQSRITMSLLYSLNIYYLVVNDLKEYEELAIKMALDSSGSSEELFKVPEQYRDLPGSFALKRVRAEIESKRESSPLFDEKSFVKNFDKALLAVWKKHLESNYEHIDVQTEDEKELVKRLFKKE